MGCGGSKENTLERPGGGRLTIWGDYFNSDTRTILSVLYIAGVPYQLEEIDMFKGDHKKDSYLAINPSGQIPMITEGSFKILGGNSIFLIYLCNSNQRIKDKLYPTEVRAEIEKHLSWFQSRMRPCAGRLTRMIVHPQAFGDKAPSQAEIKREQDELFKKLLPSLDQQLINKKYFCGDEVTIADLQYYNEISTIVTLIKKNLDESEYPNLAAWFNDRMSQIPDIMILNKKLKEIINKYNFQF